MYEIILGGSANRKSSIRRCKGGCEKARFNTKQFGVLAGEEMRSFRVTINEGHITVGRVGDDSPFLQWNDPEPIPVEYLGFATGANSRGLFHFCDMGKRKIFYIIFVVINLAIEI